MCFIFKHQQPVLIFTIHVHCDFNRTCIDFFGFIQVIQLACLFENLCSDCAKIHQCYRLFLTACIDNLSVFEIVIIHFTYVFIFNIDVFQNRIECCMTAMVAPVCIDDFDFRDSWITLFFILEIALQECDIRKIHRQSMSGKECSESCFIQSSESFQNLRKLWLIICFLDCFRLGKLCFTCFNRVDQSLSDLCLVFFTERTLDVVQACCTYRRSLLHRGKLNALRSGIRTLIKLTWQIFNRKYPFVFRRCRCCFLIYIIYLRLGKNISYSVVPVIGIDVFNIISIDDTYIFHTGKKQCFCQFISDSVCFNRKRSFLFYKAAKYCHYNLTFYQYRVCSAYP